jgi:hypothetical protein
LGRRSEQLVEQSSAEGDLRDTDASLQGSCHRQSPLGRFTSVRGSQGLGQLEEPVGIASLSRVVKEGFDSLFKRCGSARRWLSSM